MEQSHFYVLVFTTVFIISLSTVAGLECYACEHQKGNNDKCIKTTKQCEEHQDICITDIQWGLPPYWVPYGDREHSISKNCDTKAKCYEKENDIMKYCKRDWFDDWRCVECCSGDLCNYYVTLGASNAKASFICSLVPLVMVFIWQRLL